MKPDNQY